jgi:hypothetical protein
MISLIAMLGVFIVFFAFVGALRGWAKEMLVAFSAILALFLINIFVQYTPVGGIVKAAEPSMRVIIHASIIAILAVFGYSGPTLSGVMRGRLAREKLQDVLLGIVFGALNGYLVIGSIFYYLHQENYPFQPFVFPPPEGDLTELFIPWLAPAWLVPPLIYFAVGLAFVFVIILFV